MCIFVKSEKMKNDSCCNFTFIVLILIMVLSNSFYALAAPFLPPVLEAKEIPHGLVGIVFAAFSIATVIFSPIVA